MKMLKVALTLVVIAATGKGASAHEFWIDPVAVAVDQGQPIVADLRVGEGYRGGPQPFLPQAFRRSEVVTTAGARPFDARLGTIPALQMAGLPDGLAIIVHETAGQSLVWSDWAKFASFAAHKDLGDVAAMQAARGLDQLDVAEDYVRFAKSLVAVGSGAGADRRMGLRTEFVALTNPFVDPPAAVFAAQLWLGDIPRAQAQVEVFAKAPDGTVATSLHRTDDRGIVRLPVAAGYRYMLDAVVLEAVMPQVDGDAEWRTLWANLTFGVPG